MPTPRKPSRWTSRRRRGAAIQLIVGGVLLMIVPAFLGGESTVVAGLRALSPIAWLMGVGGAVLLLFLRDDRSLSTKSTGARTPAAVSLHPQPVRARYREQRPLQRPATDPLQAYEDTEIFFEDSGRPV